ncbi:MAG: hypothetical protein RLZZ387_4406 [Chloroflexota bacterium]|jgi:hypothetical protein
MRPARVLFAALAAFALAACGGAASSTEFRGTEPGMGAPAVAEAPMPAATAMESAPGMDMGGVSQEAPAVPGQSQSAQIPTQRLVIRNASVSLQVQSVQEAEAAVRATVERLGGYIVSADTSGADEYMIVRITFRVPSDRFDDALTGVQGLAAKLVSRTVTGADVTEEYVDLESRLRTLEATRDRLLDLLARAATVEEALTVNTALTDVQGQVEQVKGRMQYLKQSSALSTVSVELAPVPVTPIVPEDEWQPLQVARAALRDLLGFGQGLVNIAIVVLVWSPLWLPLGLLARWGLRRLAAGRKPVAPTPPVPPAPVS